MWSLIVLSFFGFASGVKFTDPVNTPVGQIRGMYSGDGAYSKFLGIPFAQVNAKNPFGISAPHPGFDRVFEAINDTIVMCPQSLFHPNVISSLDCLHLNIYVPNNAERKMPVLVWIYGGIFDKGYARLYDDERYMIPHKVIFVSFNYRVGPYGFMCLDIEEVPGNQGLKDQYLALKWLKENIGAFGGDANKITVMSESSGAILVDLHILSDLPKLFNRAILQSGSGYVPVSVIPSNNMVPIKMAKQLGLSTDNITEALSFLTSMSTESIISTYEELDILIRPCVEKKFPNIERFISIHPEHNNKRNSLKNISILAGFSNKEGIFQLHSFERKYIKLYEKLSNSIFQQCIDLQFDTTEMSIMVDKVRRFYIGDNEVEQKIDELIDFYSDFFFIFPMQRSLTRYVEAGAQVYQYLFSYDGDRNYMKKKLNSTQKGATHGDDLGYLFNFSHFKKSNLTEQPTATDQLIIDRMTLLWTNFAKYGNPTPATSELVPVIWPRVTEDEAWYLNIDTDLIVDKRPYHKRMLFWDMFLIANQDKLW